LLGDQFNPYVQKLQQENKFDPQKHVDNSFLDSLGRPADWAYNAKGGLHIAPLSDGQALDGSLYYSTTHKALMYKGAEGKLFQLVLKEISTE
jgi:hypothetical protein